ncbi:HNH endonuclease [Stenotrophobium rhamnosiphilum]|uniref:HNH endonuclease n=1 Tax=Stenotrophobium rhamnosiphilum TaxID=2029166 RepID=A0A2T5MC72_9GAMM|nr:HNH endonuclease [Stenotrophobium rhamnosiphilum]
MLFRLAWAIEWLNVADAVNRWGIPYWLEMEVRARDKNCVYCAVLMIERAPRGSSRKAVATWEHIINDARIITRENIALCCASCNSSKGQKFLSVWIASEKCIKRGVTEATIAPIIQLALKAEMDSVRLERMQ